VTGHRIWDGLDADCGLIGASSAALSAAGPVVMAAGAALESVLQLLDEASRAAGRSQSDSETSRLNADRGGYRKVSSRLAALLPLPVVRARRTQRLVEPTVGAAAMAAGYGDDFASLARVRLRPPARCVAVPSCGKERLNCACITRTAGVALDPRTTAKAQLSDDAARALSEYWSGRVQFRPGGHVATAVPVPWVGWVVRPSEVHQATAGAIGQPVALVARAPATARSLGGPAGLPVVEGLGAPDHLVARDEPRPPLGAWTPSGDTVAGPGAAASWCHS
jgi:thiamine biosynthesis lipoprotein